MPTLATLIIREFYEHAAVSRDHTSALACSSRAES
jgi:protein-arginine kinase activator protein McsA